MSFLFKPTTLTSTSQNQQQQTGNYGSTSTSTPTLSPELQSIMSSLANYSQGSMTNPTAAMSPIRNAGLQGINQAYASVPGQVAKQMASRGYGSSGAAGNAMYSTNLARAGAVSGLEGQLANMGLQQSQFGAGLGEQLLNSLKGTTASTSGTSSMSGTSSGSQTQPGPSIFSSLLGSAAGIMGLGGALGWKPFGSSGGSGSGAYSPGSAPVGQGGYSYDPNSWGA